MKIMVDTPRKGFLFLGFFPFTRNVKANWNILGNDFQRTGRTNSSTIPDSVKEKCKFETTHEGEHFYNSPVVVDGTIYVGSIVTSGLLSLVFEAFSPLPSEEPQGYVYSINADDCKMNWEYAAGAWVEMGVLFENGVVYFGNGNGQFIALEADLGEELWVYTQQPEEDRNAINSSPLLIDDVLYFGSRSGHMNMLNKSTGDLIRRVEVNGDFHSPLALSSRDSTRMYGATAPYGDSGINVYAFNVTTGDIIWENSMPGTIYNYSPVVDNQDRVYYSSLGNAVAAFEGETGEKLWETEIPGFGSRSSISLGIGDDTIYLSGFFTQLLAVNASTGEIEWKTCLEGGFSAFSEGAVVDKKGDLAIGDYTGYLTKVSGKDGSIMWQICHTDNGCDCLIPRPLQTSIQGPPVLVDDVLYFGSWDGNIYVIGNMIEK